MKLKICLLLLIAAPVFSGPAQFSRYTPPPRVVACKPTPTPAPAHVLTWRDYFHILHSEEIILRDSAKTDAERQKHDALVHLYLLWLAGGGVLHQDELDQPYTGPAVF